MALLINSSAFDVNGLIPNKYTCDGRDVSIPLSWSGIPAGTKSITLIMDDPDAPVGTWDHWILFNMPSGTTELPEDIKNLPAGTRQGKNSWGKTGYGGPCPPDKEHRYFFKLYALDSLLELKEGVAKKDLEKAMQGHILGKAELIGRYDRPR
ncbi:MAG: YbhB/YbcL family Raf kinase inhibitor-like protein [Deltaproteobacteria bacterium]|nr:YbhB/YbcL family Raf kinase inhibitor-like protein [Deltaproteobacteria bacterium]